MEYAVTTLATNGLSLASNLTYQLLQSTYQTLKSFATKNHYQINEVVEEYDLYTRLELIESLVHEISTKEVKFQDTTQKIIKKINEVLEQIQGILKQIQDKIDRHNQKYLASYRTLNYDASILQLKKQIQLMNQRYQMFLDVLM
jgi:methyl-accepting chemotaxis protein